MGLLKTVMGIALVAGGGALAATNPAQTDYETYASEKLSEYVSSTICPEFLENLNQVLQNPCSVLLENNQDQIHKLVREQTERSNFVLFSLYQTRLTIPGIQLSPAYEVKTFGIGQNFFTYQAGRV